MKLRLKKNVPLARYSTFKIGGKARFFFLAKNKKEILKAIEWAKREKLPFFILGGGSNVLFRDEGFNGLIIKMGNSNLKIKGERVLAGAGVSLQKLVFETINKGLEGLEWAVGIPGTLGGGIYGNCGAFGKEMKDVVEKVKVIEIKNGKFKIKELKNKKCQFQYRESIFKKNKNLIILEAILSLKRGNKRKLREKIKEILKIRKEKQPLEYPSAGSVFKNIPLKKVPKKIQEKFKDKIKNGFLPAGVLIEGVGLKGKKIGGAKISEKHANFILNYKNAKAKDVLALIELIKKKVKEKFKIELKEEIEIL